jgi:hypothetical protein
MDIVINSKMSCHKRAVLSNIESYLKDFAVLMSNDAKFTLLTKSDKTDRLLDEIKNER